MIALIVLAVLLSTMLLCGAMYLAFGWFAFFYHDVLGWHMPMDGAEQWHDGCSMHAVCKHCGKEILQDSQGNWFTRGD